MNKYATVTGKYDGNLTFWNINVADGFCKQDIHCIKKEYRTILYILYKCLSTREFPSFSESYTYPILYKILQ